MTKKERLAKKMAKREMATQKMTKKERLARELEIRANEKAREEEFESLVAFRNKHNNTTHKAAVHWFDRSSGYGSVHIDDVGSFHIFASDLKGAKSRLPHLACVYLNEGDVVDVKLNFVFFNAFAIAPNHGIVDEEALARHNPDNMCACKDRGGFTGMLAPKEDGAVF